MYASTFLTCTSPFHDNHDILSGSQFPPYAAYANLNRPPTPPPEMHGTLYQHEANTIRQDCGHGTLAAAAAATAGQNHKEWEYKKASSPANPTFLESTDTKQDSLIAPSFQIPKAVNHSGGSLSELAAEITCLFWFESSELLQQIEDSPLPLVPMRQLVKDAIPTTGFKKWVTTILSTTLVGANVVILALLFIHRLKKLNPSVKGKPGSEYRLLTVALMLGNKFLDDNTYTNKTWADVSGINVSEVHIMEVEFLSNMKYNLYTSSHEWQQWQTLLGQFAAYFEKAQLPISQRVLSQMSRNTAPILPSASSLRLPMTLPSPPSSTQASPPYGPDQFNGSFTNGLTPAQSPLVLAPVVNTRKRSVDDRCTEPPAKRIAAYNNPRPMLPIPTLQQNHTNLPQLPMPQRAMGLVYPAISASLVPTAYTAAGATLPMPISRYNSPYMVSAGESSAATVAPIRMPPELSPATYLQQRSSPYRPVHDVSTLLYPPPSTALQPRPQNIEQSQMHYQPLSKQAQLHTGRLPYVNLQNGWQYPQNGRQWQALPPGSQQIRPPLP